MAAYESDSLIYADNPAIEITLAEIKKIQRDSITCHRKLSEYIKSVYAENKSIAEFIAIKVMDFCVPHGYLQYFQPRDKPDKSLFRYASSTRG